MPAPPATLPQPATTILDPPPLETTPADEAVARQWALERYRIPPAGDGVPARGYFLSGLTPDPALVAAATTGPPHPDPLNRESLGAVITRARELGDGWWEVTLTTKSVKQGQIGVVSTPGVIVNVRVAGGLVIADGEL